MSAVTDMEACVRFDPQNQPGISNLLTIMSSLSGEPIEQLVQRFAGKGYGEFKSAVADVVCAQLSEIQARYQQVIQSGMIEQTLQQGGEQARRLARRKLDKVQRKIGMEFRKK